MSLCSTDADGVPLHNEWLDMSTKVYVTKDEDHVSNMTGAECGLLCDAIRHIASDMETCIRDLCPDGGEKELALGRLGECVTWAVKSIERA